MSGRDITPTIRFDLRPSVDELLSFVNPDVSDATVYREMVQILTAKARDLTVQNVRRGSSLNSKPVEIA